MYNKDPISCLAVSFQQGEPQRKSLFNGETFYFFQNTLFLRFFFQLLGTNKYINRHIVSEDCIGFIMICASTIFTTGRTIVIGTLTYQMLFYHLKPDTLYLTEIGVLSSSIPVISSLLGILLYYSLANNWLKRMCSWIS